jgi:hypothetical protein
VNPQFNNYLNAFQIIVQKMFDFSSYPLLSTNGLSGDYGLLNGLVSILNALWYGLASLLNIFIIFFLFLGYTIYIMSLFVQLAFSTLAFLMSINTFLSLVIIIPYIIIVIIMIFSVIELFHL